MFKKNRVQKSIGLSLFIILVISLNSCSYYDKLFKSKTMISYSHDTQSMVETKLQRLNASKMGNPQSYTINGVKYKILKSSKDYTVTGKVLIYPNLSTTFTSLGQKYNSLRATISNNVLPIPSYAKLINLKNNKQTIVLVNDRGPFGKSNTIGYISKTVANNLGIDLSSQSTDLVRLETIPPYTLIKNNSISLKYDEKKYYIILYQFTNLQEAEHAIHLLSLISKNSLSKMLKLQKSSQIDNYLLVIGPFTKQKIKRIKQKISHEFGIKSPKILIRK